MSQLLMSPLTPEDQRKLALGLYSLMDGQVRSYNASRGASGTSVPTETARELMESMVYTLDAAGAIENLLPRLIAALPSGDLSPFFW